VANFPSCLSVGVYTEPVEVWPKNYAKKRQKVLKTDAFLLKKRAFLLKNGALLRKNTRFFLAHLA